MMKELDQHIKEDADKPKIESEVKKKQVFLGSRLVQPGQKWWQFQISNGELKEAEYENTTSSLKGKIVRKLVVKSGFLYCVAINKKNAEKKFIKQLTEAIIKSST